MKKVKVTLTRSVIGKSKKQKATVLALGLRKTNHSVEKEATPQVMGMINKVKHLVQYEEI
ncbi:MAG: 50S ribosomal protein L30 [Saprospiraceae bacterium]|nr:50S ribosomal protein L30 [Saprospiraceae bacterium]|tara:strand:+ start:420 stop:599 length:180 start_codon:yes stop_codon:yes gene_type:complete